MSRVYYHELRKQIEDYVRERGLEQATIDLHIMLGSILDSLRKEREVKPEDKPQADHETNTIT